VHFYLTLLSAWSQGAILRAGRKTQCFSNPEDPAVYAKFRGDAVRRFDPRGNDDIAVVDEYAELNWRLRRIAGDEARMVAIEVKRIKIEARKNPDLAELIDGFDQKMLETLAVERLNKSNSLINLHRQETRLARRLKQLAPELKRLEDNFTTRIYMQLKKSEAAKQSAQSNDPKPLPEAPPKPQQYKSAA
jgi:hypothetical protein